MFLSIQKHCSDERLLAYVDGELPGRTADKTARHLEVCWQCRARLDEMEHQAYAVARTFSDESFLHPLHMAEIKERLTAAQREYERRLASQIPMRLRVSAGWWWAAAACACMGLLAAVVFWRGQTQKHEILAKSEQAEQVLITQPVRQTLHVELSETRPRSLKRNGKIEIWSEPKQNHFALRWWDAQAGSLRQALWRPQDDRQYAYRDTSAPGVIPHYASLSKVVSLADLSQQGVEIEAIERQFMNWLENRQWKPITLAQDFAGLVSQDGVELNLERISGADGARVLRLTARRRAGSVTTEIVFEMDGTSYRPLLLRMAFETPDRAVELSLISERVETVPAAFLRTSVFTPEVGVTAPPARVVKAPPLPPGPTLSVVTASPAFTEAELSEKQIQVEYALHRFGACLGEPVQVTRKGASGIAVTGLVADTELRDVLRAALNNYTSAQWLTVDIRTVDEALSSVLAQKPRESADGAAGKEAVTANTMVALKPPVEDFLVEYFREHPEPQAAGASSAAGASPAKDPSRQAAQFAGRAVSLSQAALAEAWALRRLAQSYGGFSDMPVRSQWFLKAMIIDHLRALREQLDRQFELLAPVAPPAQAQDSDDDSNRHWQDYVLRLFRAIENLHDATLELFAGTPPKTGAASLSQKLAQSASILKRLRSATQVGEAVVQDQFPSRQDVAIH
jgi:hypothetical protein